MTAFAQTNIQLFNQLRSEGYSNEDRDLVRDAYEFGLRLFSGLFLPSGKPFIDHLVGTASILASLHMPIEVVAAGLIHAAYLHGDFGSGRSGISEVKRREVRQALGKEVEDHVARYDRYLWNPQKIRSLHDVPTELNPVDSGILVIRLANELEHQLDLGGMYYAGSGREQEKYQRHMGRSVPLMATIAKRMGYPSLANEMETACKSVALAAIPIEPCIGGRQKTAYLIAPRSYIERFWVRIRHKMAAGHASCSGILSTAKLLSRKSAQVALGQLRKHSQPISKE